MKRIRDMINKKSEMQIAPLIDVVFLLLIYFMVTASLVKIEADLSFELPLPALINVPIGDTVEVVVEVSAPGIITIEGMTFDSQDDLIQQLVGLQAAADSTESDLIVSILPDDQALHESIIPVMDACAAADVKNLAFSTAM